MRFVFCHNKEPAGRTHSAKEVGEKRLTEKLRHLADPHRP